MRQTQRSASWWQIPVLFICGFVLVSGWYLWPADVIHGLKNLVGSGTSRFHPAATTTDIDGAASTKLPQFMTTEDVSNLDRLIVVAHYHESLAWTAEVDIPIKLVEKDNPDNPDNLNSNNMTEPTSYLYYMIKYYDSLPDVTVFVHGHGDDQMLNETAWTVDEYKALYHPDVMQSCNTRHKEERGWLIWLGNVDARPPPPEDLDVIAVSHEYMKAFHDLFDFLRLDPSEGGMGMTLPHFISTPCCSAFSVDRDTIRRVPRDRLVRLFDYLEAGTNWRHGNAMEYVWTVLFNQDQWT